VDNARLNSNIKNDRHKFPICALSIEDVKKAKLNIVKEEITDWMTIEDTVNSLERLRNYQLSDILGKYKLF